MPGFITDNSAAVIALIRATIALAVTFGLRLTAEQTGLTITIIGLVLSFITVKTTVPKAPSAAAAPASIQLPPAPPPS